jgi:hypothetical protein
MKVTLDLPDDLAARLEPLRESLPQILELGLREFSVAPSGGLMGIAAILEWLASLPTPEEIVALRPSEALQVQILALSEKSQAEGLSPEEERVWEQYQFLEHLIRVAKAKAFAKLNAA